MTEEEDEEFVALTKDLIRSKITIALTVYPRLSPSMLQVGIGTGVPPILWRPVFNEMVKEGLILERSLAQTTPKGREQSYKVIELKKNNAD